MNTTDIQPYAAAPLDERHRYAQALASAGDLIPRALFGPPINGAPAAPSSGKVLLVLETGAMLGLHPVAALQGVHVIEGKAGLSSALMSAVLRGAGHKVRIRETGTIEGGDYSVTTTLVRADDPDEPFTSTWTPHRAARAGLCTYAAGADGVWKVTARSRGGQPLPWESFTESLCKARSLSEVARDGGQDALMGIRYTPEELGAIVDATGDVVLEATVEPTEPAAPSATPKKRATTGTQGTRRAAPEQADPAPTPADDAPTAETAVLVPENAGLGSDADGTYAIDPDTSAEVPGSRVTKADADAAAAATEVPFDAAAVKARVQSKQAARKADPDADLRAAEAAEQEAAARAAADAQDDGIVDAELVEDEPADDGPAAVLTDESEYDRVTKANPLAYEDRLGVATTTAQVKEVWDDAHARNELTTELRQTILRTKAGVESR